jgi:hypothetical protein
MAKFIWFFGIMLLGWIIPDLFIPPKNLISNLGVGIIISLVYAVFITFVFRKPKVPKE